jgi:glycosyltransferase involved in cell wall biosynthesis
MSLKVIHLISSMSFGGRERQLANILKAFPEHKAIVLNYKENDYVSNYGLQNVEYIKEKGFRQRINIIHLIVKKENAQIIWSWGVIEVIIGLTFFFNSKVKHVNGSIRHGILRFNRKQVSRLIMLHLSKYRVANSKAGLRANFLRRGYILNNGIDSRFFTTKEEIERKYIKVELRKLSLVSVANLVPYKDYFTVLNSLEKLKKEGYTFNYKIIGKGPMKEEIQKQIKALNLDQDVDLVGQRSDVDTILKESDIFIHSSMGEGLSNAILEAMASGLPCIATETGGTSELLPQEQMFSFKDYMKLYQLLKDYFDNRYKLYDVGLKMYNEAIEKYSMESMITQYEKIIERIL